MRMHKIFLGKKIQAHKFWKGAEGEFKGLRVVGENCINTRGQGMAKKRRRGERREKALKSEAERSRVQKKIFAGDEGQKAPDGEWVVRGGGTVKKYNQNHNFGDTNHYEVTE